ncbi:MAG: hypothetical protein M3N23_03380, partial [Pseudomonadota bacterium]|nr:hypothetical protein [Pseudomonadota bacterium]
DSAGAVVAQQHQTLNVLDFSLQGLRDGGPYGNGRTISVSASDRVGSVRLFADGYPVGAQNVRNSGGGFDIFPALMTTLGKRNLVLQAIDTSGNLIGQQTLTVSVQNLAILDPHAGASLLPNATLTLHASASRQIARIDYDADGYALGSASDAGANFELVTTLTRTGARTLTATGYDAAGAYVQRVSESVTVGAAPGNGGGIGGADVEARIKDIVANSRCAAHQFPDQGTAPRSYLTGMALTYAKSYCEVKTGASTAAALLASPLRQDGRDALTRYALDSSDPIQRLRSLYTLGIGEGLRESSGNPTEGYDTSAPSHTAENAESGLFQTSYDSRNYAGVSVDGISYAGARQWLDTLTAQYQNNPALCRYATFLGGQRDRNVPNIGSGPGAQFQAFSKDCPAFATEYAMVIFRLNRNHYGPIVRHEAEYAPSCAAMLQQVESEAKCSGQ